MFCICFAQHTTRFSQARSISHGRFGRIGDHVNEAVFLLLQIEDVESLPGE